MLNNLLRFQGSAVYGMVGMTSGAVLNVALDPLFIYTFEMGVLGASLATMISQFVGFCLLIAGCAKGGNIAIRFVHFSPRLWHYREICRGGLPSLCRQGLLALSTVVLNHSAQDFGDAAIAALSIVRRVYWFAGSALIGWGQGFQPVCGFNYGAGLYSRVRRAFWFCFKSSFWVLLAFSILGIVFAEEIIAIFRPDDPDVIRIGSLALQMQCFVMPLIGWVVLHNMMLQTIGRAGPATLLALGRQGLFLLPALFILKPWLGVLGIQLAQPIADFATVIMAVPLGMHALRDMVERENAGMLQNNHT
jgi:Na+-driven multidrug efflux pump